MCALTQKDDFNIFNLWMTNTPKYPYMAHDLLVRHASTSASKSSFSTEGQMTGQFRSILNSKTAKAHICGQDYITAGGML